MAMDSVFDKWKKDGLCGFFDFLTREFETVTSWSELEGKLVKVLVPEYADRMLISEVQDGRIIRRVYSSSSLNSCRLHGPSGAGMTSRLDLCEQLAVEDGEVQSGQNLNEICRLSIIDTDGIHQQILDIAVPSVIVVPVKSKGKVAYLLTVFPEVEYLKDIDQDFWYVASNCISRAFESVVCNLQTNHLEKAARRPNLKEYLNLLSHQLRTPLTVAMANVGLMRRTESTALGSSLDRFQTQLQAAEDSLRMMNKILKSLGELNDLFGRPRAEAIDLVEFLHSLCRDPQCAFESLDSREIIIHGNEVLLRNAINCCLDRIQGHSAHGHQETTIFLSAEEDYAKILIVGGRNNLDVEQLRKLLLDDEQQPEDVRHQNGSMDIYIASEIVKYHLGRFFELPKGVANGYAILLPAFNRSRKHSVKSRRRTFTN